MPDRAGAGAGSAEPFAGWPALLSRLVAGRDLTAAEARAALAEVFEGGATPAQLAAFVFGLRCKGETVEEMAGLVQAMLAAATPLPVPEALRARLVDTCGTGGDGAGTINVSTIAALVAAGAGVPVCKHGGRAASARPGTGSADLLEALGVVIDLGPDGVRHCLEAAGIAFCFAPRYHPAMRVAAPTRSELGVRTAFNFLGPLANPARVGRQVVGVGDPAMATKMCRVLAAGGATHVAVVYGSDGLDELTTTGTSTMVAWQAGTDAPVTSVVDPQALGLQPARLEDLRGGDTEENVACARRVLAGGAGAHREVVLLNAAAALVVGGGATDLPHGLEVAAAAIDTGAAAATLERLVASSREAAG